MEVVGSGEGLGLGYEGADDCGVASFDQARLIRQNQWLAANGIDPSGQSCFWNRGDFAYQASADQECPWMQRLSRGYDRPGLFSYFSIFLQLISLSSCFALRQFPALYLFFCLPSCSHHSNAYRICILHTLLVVFCFFTTSWVPCSSPSRVCTTINIAVVAF